MIALPVLALRRTQAAPRLAALSDGVLDGFDEFDHFGVDGALARVGKPDVVSVVAMEGDNEGCVFDRGRQCCQVVLAKGEIST